MAAGDGCVQCGGPLDVVKTVEIGHIFKLGYKYSESMGLRVLNADGKEVTPIMGSYGIGIERILCCAIELFHDKDGMMLPAAIAPFHVVVTPVNNADAAQKEAAERIYGECLALGLDALLDDRDERPGVKFKDADLIGVPFRITVGQEAGQRNGGVGGAPHEGVRRRRGGGGGEEGGGGGGVASEHRQRNVAGGCGKGVVDRGDVFRRQRPARAARVLASVFHDCSPSEW